MSGLQTQWVRDKTLMSSKLKVDDDEDDKLMSKTDDVDECKNSTSPSVSSPGSHRSDSSLELEAKTQPWVNPLFF